MDDQVNIRRTTVGDIDVSWTADGNRGDPAVLLVAGLGAQLITWDEGFTQALVERGLYVIRFDNRDAGLSTHLGAASDGVAYTLSDLAADTAGLITALDLDAVHVVGASMGGMIGQLLAIEHPDRVRSLTSIMSTTGDRAVGQASSAATAILTTRPAATREAVLDGAVQAYRVLGSPGFPVTEEVVRERSGRAFDRAYDPVGFGRQLQACLVAQDRTTALRGVRVPTLVIHGADDALIDVSGGRATAAAVPGAELAIIDGMGHELPEGVWPDVADRIAALVRGASSG